LVFIPYRNLDNHLGTFITSNEVEKALKVTKNGKSVGEYNVKSELYKYTPEELKLRLLQFLGRVYTKDCIPDEWRNAVVIQIFKKGDRRDPKNYRGISILNTCHKIYFNICNIKLESCS